MGFMGDVKRRYLERKLLREEELRDKRAAVEKKKIAKEDSFQKERNIIKALEDRIKKEQQKDLTPVEKEVIKRRKAHIEQKKKELKQSVSKATKEIGTALFRIGKGIERNIAEQQRAKKRVKQTPKSKSIKKILKTRPKQIKKRVKQTPTKKAIKKILKKKPKSVKKRPAKKKKSKK